MAVAGGARVVGRVACRWGGGRAGCWGPAYHVDACTVSAAAGGRWWSQPRTATGARTWRGRLHLHRQFAHQPRSGSGLARVSPAPIAICAASHAASGYIGCREHRRRLNSQAHFVGVARPARHRDGVAPPRRSAARSLSHWRVTAGPLKGPEAGVNRVRDVPRFASRPGHASASTCTATSSGAPRRRSVGRSRSGLWQSEQ